MRIQSTMILFFCLFIILMGRSTLSKENDSQSLNYVTDIERDMNVNEIHTYTIDIDSDRFLYIRVRQIGIDLLVKVYNPEGKLVDEIDSPTGTIGDENVFLTTESSGIYKIEIHPYDPLAENGNYQLIVEKNVEAADTPHGRVDQLFAPWDKKGTPGAAVAVVKEGKIIYSKGYGEANLEYHIPITPSTVFHMASVSKQFTAYAIAVLARKGKLSLDDDIRKYLPEVPDFGETITIRHLVHHTSGMRDQWNLLAAAGWRLDDVITREQILRLVANQKELNFSPGDEFLYCNTGYTLMAEIVAKVSGKSFAEWTKENIFDPLNMDNTLFYDDHEKIAENRAYSYGHHYDGSFKKRILSYANVGATSLFTTAENLSKWAMNFDYPLICNQDLIDQMEERFVLNSGDTIAYAFGQGVGEYKSLKRISHGGSDAGYRTYLGRFPDQNISIIVLSNLSSISPGSLGMKIADIYLSEFIQKEESDPESPDEIQIVQIDPQIVESYTGLYELEPGVRFRLIRDGYRLMIQVPSEGWKRFVARSENSFSSQDGSVELEFIKDGQGKVTTMTIFTDEEEMVTRRVEPFSLEKDILNEYAGEYYSPELKTSYSLVVEDSTLIAHHQRHDNIGFQPQSKDNFTTGSWWMEQIQFERGESQQITGFRLDSGRVRNLLFIRQ